MKTTAFIYIYKLPEIVRRGRVSLSSEEFYEFLDFCCQKKICRSNELCPRDSLSSFLVESAAENPDFRSALDKLSVYGWTPYYGNLPDSATGQIFEMSIQRVWTKAEVKAAPLLRLGVWSCQKYCLAGLARWENGNFIARVASVGAHTNQKRWSEAYGYLDGGYNLVIDSAGKELLESNLKGLKFTPLLWDSPEAVKTQYWLLGSQFEMPPSLTPVVTLGSGMPQTTHYEDGAFQEVELAYEKASLQELGEFDIAWTHEITGETAEDRPNYRGRYLIVSQRFREVAEALITSRNQRIDYYPVKLV